MRKLLVLIVLILSSSAIAQDDIDYPVITSENILQLESVHQLSFETDIYGISMATTERIYGNPNIDVGWFIYNSVQDTFAFIDADNAIQLIRSSGVAGGLRHVTNVVDVVTFGDGYYATLSTTPVGFNVGYDNLTSYSSAGLYINVLSSAIPSSIWITCPEIASDDGKGCYANVQDTSSIIYTLPIFDVGYESIILDIQESDLEQRPYLPASDTEAVVRIGRIPLPYVVTSSLDGNVKLWNLDTDEVVYEVDNGTGEPSVFGNINTNVTHLVWRDNANKTLYLLNFETGENREIVPLNGNYAQWYFLTNDASAIIAVNLGGEPNVVVWDTATGEQTDLGNYLDCERPQPDMARLTQDGTTLIIGCDTGLDIWRVNLEG